MQDLYFNKICGQWHILERFETCIILEFLRNVSTQRIARNKRCMCN